MLRLQSRCLCHWTPQQEIKQCHRTAYPQHGYQCSNPDCQNHHSFQLNQKPYDLLSFWCFSFSCVYFFFPCLCIHFLRSIFLFCLFRLSYPGFLLLTPQYIQCMCTGTDQILPLTGCQMILHKVFKGFIFHLIQCRTYIVCRPVR